MLKRTVIRPMIRELGNIAVHLLELDAKPTHDHGWEIRVGRPDRPKAHGFVPPLQARGVRLAAGMLPVDSFSANASTWAKGELRVGRALFAALEASGPPGKAYLRAIEAAKASGEALVLLVCVPNALRDVPWELLPPDNGHPSLEVTGMGAIVRRVLDAPRPTPPDADVAVHAVLEAFAQDTAVRPVHDIIGAAWTEAGRPAPVSLDDAPGARLVTLVLGKRGRRALSRILLDGSEADPVSELAERGELVWPIVTSGELRLPSPLRRLPTRLVERGAVAALGGDTRMDPDAAAAIARGLHAALLGGESLLAATIAGRASLRELDLPMADARWWRTRLWIGHASTLTRIPIPLGETIDAWPAPAPDAADLLRRAAGLGAADGYLGVEQLAEALLHGAPLGLADLATQIERRRAIWDSRSRLLAWARPPGAVPLTPRLRDIAKSLPVGFDSKDLWAAILADPYGWRRWLTGDTDIEPSPAAALVVLGGPEDGRHIVLDPGDGLGRAANDVRSEVQLYADTLRSDPRLSRRHLRWLDEGWIQLLAPARCKSPGGEPIRIPEGPMAIHAGDLLELTPTTWLVGVGGATATSPPTAW